MSAPNAYLRILGSTFVHRFDEVILTIGDQTLTRYELVHQLDCAATARAAGILTKALKDLSITTVKDALKLSPVDLATQPGVGVTAIYVFLCWQRMATGSLKEVNKRAGDVTVATLKERVRKRQQRDKPARSSKARGQLHHFKRTA